MLHRLLLLRRLSLLDVVVREARLRGAHRRLLIIARIAEVMVIRRQRILLLDLVIKTRGAVDEHLRLAGLTVLSLLLLLLLLVIEHDDRLLKEQRHRLLDSALSDWELPTLIQLLLNTLQIKRRQLLRLSHLLLRHYGLLPSNDHLLLILWHLQHLLRNLLVLLYWNEGLSLTLALGLE